MNETKIIRAVSGLNAMARKVLDAVPIESPWSMSQVAAELKRLGGNYDPGVVQACLTTLAEHRLVRSPAPGLYVRVTARAAARPAKEDEAASTAALAVVPAAPEPARDTLDRIDQLSTGLRRAAADLNEAAGQLDALAIEFEERVAEVERNSEKLRQVQALLKSLAT